MKRKIGYIPNSHLDLYWLGSYRTCLTRGSEILKEFIDRCNNSSDETFLVETVVFLEYFLNNHQEYKPIVKKLFDEKRLDIGTAYVDRWENLIQEESLIRNIKIGKSRLKELLEIDSPLVAHPDLPGMVSQIPQIYQDANIKGYITTRKIYENGKVWKYTAPENSSIHVLNYPLHYMFLPMSRQPNTRASDGLLKLDMEKHMPINEIAESWESNIIAIAGGAGDLSMRKDFHDRYNQKYLQDYIREYSKEYSEFEFGYTTPMEVINDHIENNCKTPENMGEIPSVWGVACDEEVKFFQRDRKLERLLLIAEKITTIASALDINWIPKDVEEWQGKYYECAFYQTDDNFQKDNIFAKLWEMIIFTQDHNGGGYEGAQSSFQKRVIQLRALEYTQKIINQVLAHFKTDDNIVLFNPNAKDYQGIVRIELDEFSENQSYSLVNDSKTYNIQVDKSSHNKIGYFVSDNIDALNFKTYTLKTTQDSQESKKESLNQELRVKDNNYLIENDKLTLSISKDSGNIVEIHNKTLNTTLNDQDIGNIYMVSELHSDVTLRIDKEKQAITQTFVSFSCIEYGELFNKYEIKKLINNANVSQYITVFKDQAKFTLQTQIHWWGDHYKQLRMTLNNFAHRTAITYGTPFYGNSLQDKIEGATPRLMDELLLEDYDSYREIQKWLNIKESTSNVAILTESPGVYIEDNKIESVLMRTSPSCGDHRYFWENSGEQNYFFEYCLLDNDSKVADVMNLAHDFYNHPCVLAQDLEIEETQTKNSNDVNVKVSPIFTQANDYINVSAFYQSDDSYILRIFNNSSETQEVIVNTNFFKNKDLYLSSVLEETKEKINDNDKLSFKPWQFKTFIYKKVKE